MSKKLVVKKDNALIAASYNFTLAEQRLILLAVAQGQQSIKEQHTITAEAFAEAFKVSPATAYESLKAAVSQLFERRFSWSEKTPEGYIRHVHARWVARIAYVDGAGLVQVRFSEDVVPLLDELKSRFTAYSLEHVSELSSTHAVRLYELLISWRSVGKTPVFELAAFREQLGILPDEYPRMNNFKARVLDTAIKQINQHTDIVAQYEQHKRGRKITGFSFTFEFKQQDRDPHTIDLLTGKTDAEAGRAIRPLTEKQRQLFAERLAHHPDLSHLSKHPSYTAFAAWIFKELEKPERVQEWLPQLIACGFKTGKEYQ